MGEGLRDREFKISKNVESWKFGNLDGLVGIGPYSFRHVPTSFLD